MAKELMEIGGFITEGAEIVNHDASLSGNGTVDSPLGVVPGYNETVLYSGALTSAANLSEPMTAFEKIDIYMASDNTDVNNFHFVNTIDPNNGAKNWRHLQSRLKRTATSRQKQKLRFPQQATQLKSQQLPAISRNPQKLSAVTAKSNFPTSSES